MQILRSPLGRVRGLGSAKEGVSHWWAQRLTAIALIPLTIWFVISVIGLAGADYGDFKAWLDDPGTAALLAILVFTVFWHAKLGVQVVIEDYVHNEAAKIAGLVALNFVAVGLGVYSLVSVLMVAVAG